MRIGSLFCTVLIFTIIYAPIPNSPYLWYLIMFTAGAFCSVYQLAFTYVQSFVDKKSQGLADGITNMLCMSGAPFLTPIIGIILTSQQGGILDGFELYTSTQYRWSMWPIPAAVLISYLPSQRFKTTYSNN